MERRKQLRKYIQRAKSSLTFEKASLLHNTVCFWHCFRVLLLFLFQDYLSGPIIAKLRWLSLLRF